LEHHFFGVLTFSAGYQVHCKSELGDIHLMKAPSIRLGVNVPHSHCVYKNSCFSLMETSSFIAVN